MHRTLPVPGLHDKPPPPAPLPVYGGRKSTGEEDDFYSERRGRSTRRKSRSSNRRFHLSFISPLAKQYRKALHDFQVALDHPANLRANERRDDPSRPVELAWWIGRTHEALGDAEAARTAWTEAAQGPAENSSPRRAAPGGLSRNSGHYFPALALRRLGKEDRANDILGDLVASAELALQPAAAESVDPNNANFDRRSAQERVAAAHYLAGLGHEFKARDAFSAALAIVPAHLGAKLALEGLE